MNNQQLGTKLTLDELGVPVDVSSFDGRLAIQKAIYLAEALQVDCGYFFRWYLRGPYSPELARDAYAIQIDLAAGSDDSKNWTLAAQSKQRVAPLRALISQSDETDRARNLELLASAHFLIAQGQVRAAEAKLLVEVLAKYDKDFSEPEVANAIRDLSRCGLIKDKRSPSNSS
jgi:hypothetical protein